MPGPTLLSTSGGEFIHHRTKAEYIGFYHYALGFPFAGTITSPAFLLYDIRFGDVYDSNPDEILTGGVKAKTYRELNPQFGQHLDDPPPFKTTPTEKEYLQTRMTRYFIKNLHTGKITEAHKSTYKVYKLKNITLKNLYEAIKVEWKLSGPLEDVVDADGTILAPGIIQTNKRTMARHKQKFPEFGLVIPFDDLAKITS